MTRIKRAAWFLLFFVLAPVALGAVEGEAPVPVTIIPKTTGFFKTNFKYMVAGGPSEEVRIPIPFYVILHPQGVVLFDSGLGEDFREQVHGWWAHRLFQLLLPYQFKKSDAAVQQLKRMGIPPEAVRVLVVSHMHLDHVGGLRDFPNATVVVSRTEWESANVGRWRARLRGVMKEQLEGIEKRLRLVDFQPGTAVGPFDASDDLFGDGSLILLPTPGHTPGHESLLVTLGSGKRVFLTGDAVWVRENYLRPAPKSWFIRHFEENCDEAWETTLKIKEFSEKNPDVLIIPGHDPHVWKELPEEMR